MRSSLLLSLLAAAPVLAADLDFKEAFADPERRAAAIGTLVPGTRDWFFYHALQQQFTGDQAGFRKSMEAWRVAAEDKKRLVSLEGWDALDNRSILLAYESDPKGSVARLIQKFDLHFNDAKPEVEAGANLADHLDSALIAPAAFREEAAKMSPSSPWEHFDRGALWEEMDKLDGFDDAKTAWFFHHLSDARHPRTVDLLAKIFSAERPPAFGGAALEKTLTHAQLDALMHALPMIRYTDAFSIAWMATLPTADKASESDPAALTAHLSACRDFIMAASPSQNSLKAHVLYHHLKWQREAGNYPLEDFLIYLRLPRASHPLLRIFPDRSDKIDPNGDYKQATGRGPIRDDSELVSALLEHFLAASDSSKAFTGLIEPAKLAELQARAHLLAGHDPAKWSAGMEPADITALQKEVRVGFAPGQPVTLKGSDPVALKLDLKNTPHLTVRAFEIDLPSLARQGRIDDLSVTMDVDGLVPHLEKRFDYSQPTLQVHREVLDLPELSGAGAWLVECISGNASCRTLIRKGKLLPVIGHTAGGVELRIFDETGTLQRQASVSGAGQSYTPGDDGVIRIPASQDDPIFTAQTGKLATSLGHLAVRYEPRLHAGFHIDREQLIPGRQAKVLMMPRLDNLDTPLPLTQLRHVRLIMHATLSGGIDARRELLRDAPLEPVMEIPFEVPAHTESIGLTLVAEAMDKPWRAPESVEDDYGWNLTSVDLPDGQKVISPFLSRDQSGYFLELRGRNGEVYPSRAVTLSLHHRDYRVPVQVTLKSDAKGRINLGSLTGIRHLTAGGTDLTQSGFDIDAQSGGVNLPSTLHATTGDDIRIPLPPGLKLTDSAKVSLMQTDSEGRTIADLTSGLQSADGQVLLRGLPEGTYDLTLGENRIEVDVVAGPIRDGFTFDSLEAQQHYVPALPSIASATAGADALLIKLDRPSPETRVQVISRRFLSEWDAGLAFTKLPEVPLLSGSSEPADCAYLVDRLLSDESRYIQERRSAKKFPGSLLPRPGLLVNRWTMSKSDQVPQDGAGSTSGHPFGSKESLARNGAAPPAPASEKLLNGSFHPSFLANPSTVLYQLKPDADGTVRVPVKDLGDGQVVEIIASSPDGSSRVIVPLAASAPALRDQRLKVPLDPARHYLGTRSTGVIPAGQEVPIEGVVESEWRAFSSLDDVYQYFVANNRGDFSRFIPLLSWDQMPEQQKLDYLGDFACDEVHLFVARKDRPFFDQYVKPRLLEKREPDVVDDILLNRDLERYLRPAAWARLNAMEKALLSQSLPAARGRIARELDLIWKSKAPGAQEQDELFISTLRGNGGSASDPFAASGEVEGLNMISTPDSAKVYILNKLKTIIIPTVQFDDTSVAEAVDFIRLRARELDLYELDPAKKGINIVVEGNSGDLRIRSLQLRNVPISEALRYICDATRLRYKINDFAVTIVPATETDVDIFSRSFFLSPEGLQRLGWNHAGVKIVELLKDAGIPFPDGASATLSGSTLVVRNTPANMDLIEEFVESRRLSKPRSMASIEEAAKSTADPFAPSIVGDQAAEEPEGYRSEGLAAWESDRDHTHVWREQNYYNHRGSSGENFIPLNGFWLDLAKWDGKGPFLSPHFNECTGTTNESLLCLAMLDLPFHANAPETLTDGSTLRLKSASPMLLFYRETKAAGDPAADAPVLVRQTFHPLNDPFRTEEGQQMENEITGNFIAGVPYEMSLVVTNPSGVSRRVELLSQIPAGAIALEDQPAILSVSRDLKPYGVLNEKVVFYFPAAGSFPVYPLHVGEKDRLLAVSSSRSLTVVAKAGPEDATSWPILARDGASQAVIDRLRSADLGTLDLSLIRWRMHDRVFFDQVTTLLRDRLVTTRPLDAYGFYHNDRETMRTALESRDYVLPVGDWLDAPLLTVRPRIETNYETLEFDPLVNPRAHRFGNFPRLSNPAALASYETLLDQLGWKPALDDDDRLALCTSLLLQDRIDEALKDFDRIDAAKLTTHLQYDYLASVIAFYRKQPDKAREIAMKHLSGPQELWVKRFKTVIDQADEIARASQPSDKVAPTNDAEASTPALELAVLPDHKLRVQSARLPSTELKYYQIDLEMLFSKNPFLSSQSNDLPEILPNEVQQVALDASGKTDIEIPSRFRSGNVLVSATSGERNALKILDSTALSMSRQTSQRTLQVTDSATHAPLPETYVKIYAIMTGSDQPVFYKDGYTDLRGKFDYLSHTGLDPSQVRKLAVLISNPDKGARVEIIEL